MGRGMTRYVGNRRFRGRACVAGLVALAIVAASCGGDDDDNADATSATSETAAESSAAEVPTPTDAPSATDAGSASAPSSAESSSAAPEATGGTTEVDTTPLVIARNMDLTSLDPHRAVCDTCQFIFTSLYQTLVGLDTDNKTLIPSLAESWDVN